MGLIEQYLKIIEEERQKIIDLHKDDVSFRLIGGKQNIISTKYKLFFISSNPVDVEADMSIINMSLKSKTIDLRKELKSLVKRRIGSSRS